jgi:hypothetical protein
MVDFIPLSNVFELAERNYTFLKGSHEIYHADKHMCCFSFCFVLCVSVPFSQPLEFMMMYERSVYIVRSTVCKAQNKRRNSTCVYLHDIYFVGALQKSIVSLCKFKDIA